MKAGDARDWTPFPRQFRLSRSINPKASKGISRAPLSVFTFMMQRKPCHAMPRLVTLPLDVSTTSTRAVSNVIRILSRFRPSQSILPKASEGLVGFPGVFSRSRRSGSLVTLPLGSLLNYPCKFLQRRACTTVRYGNSFRNPNH